MEAGKRIEDLSFDINTIGWYDAEEDRKITNYLQNKYERKKAREEGIEQERRKIAREMLEANMDISTISKITSLTKEEIKKLRDR